MENKSGPFKLEFIHDEIASFYRFFYRLNSDNNDVFSIRLDNIEMKRLNLHTKTFTTVDGLEGYLNNISNNTTNVSPSNISFVRNKIHSFLNDENNTQSCIEIILPVKEGNDYTQNDINEIYNVAVRALGLWIIIDY